MVQNLSGGLIRPTPQSEKKIFLHQKKSRISHFHRKFKVVTSPLPPMKPEKVSELTETEKALEELPSPPDGTAMTDQWEWETQNPRQNELENRNTHQETGSLSSEVIEENIPKGSGLSGLQVSLGDELMDAYNEEEFIQKVRINIFLLFLLTSSGFTF